MSSVCAQVPMFGVRAECFHGIGLRHIGMPAMIDCPLPPPGPKMITSYCARRSAVARHVLRADVVVGHLQLVERLAPPAFGLRCCSRCA